MGMIWFLIIFSIPSFIFVYNLVAAICYNVKRAIAAVNEDPANAEKKDELLVGHIMWASLALSAMVLLVVLFIV